MRSSGGRSSTISRTSRSGSAPRARRLAGVYRSRSTSRFTTWSAARSSSAGAACAARAGTPSARTRTGGVWRSGGWSTTWSKAPNPNGEGEAGQELEWVSDHAARAGGGDLLRREDRRSVLALLRVQEHHERAGAVCIPLQRRADSGAVGGGRRFA